MKQPVNYHYYLLILIALAFAASSAMAIPELISIQGKLTNSNSQALTGNYSFKFEIYDSNETGKIPLWAETRTLAVNKGVFNAVLGDANIATSINTIDFNKQRWLGVFVNGEAQLPLIRLASQSSSFVAKTALGVTNPDFNRAWYAQLDANVVFVKITDSNNNSRLASGVIANPPWAIIGTSSIWSLVLNGDWNAVYARFSDINTTYAKITDVNGNYAKTSDINTTFLRNSDVNMIYIRQTDGNNWYIKITDTNNAGRIAYGAIADLNKAYYTQLDANNVLQKVSDTNNAGRLKYGVLADFNAAYYSKTDANSNFVPYVGATKNVTLGNYDLTATRFISTSALSAAGANAVALGYQTTASGAYSIAAGEYTIASGSTSVAMGGGEYGNVIASGRGSVAMGYLYLGVVSAVNDGSIAMGYADNTAGDLLSSGIGSVAMGWAAKANGNGSVSLGYDTNANATTATAIGYKSKAMGNYSTAIGWNAVAARANLVTLSQDVNVAGFLTVGNGKDMNTGLATGDLNISGRLFVQNDANVSGKLKVQNDLNVSKGTDKGVSIVSDTNRICFPGSRCAAYIDWNGTAIVISTT